MAWVSFFALVLWLPAVIYLFERFNASKAVVFAFVAAWLFLPPTIIPLSGIPDWSKSTATVFSVILCACLKQSHRLLGIQWRLYDLPVLLYCLCPFMSSVTNGLGAYDGFSAVLEELFRWGFPYLVGRAFLGNESGNRQLCLGIAVGGMLYLPLCLFEIRMSPMLKGWIYGISSAGLGDFGLRYGGYRPVVFLSNGLELGWWMCCATLATYMLWVSGAVKRLFNFPMSAWTAAMTVATVLCKSTGALTQIFLGFLLINICRRTKTTVLVWLLIALPPMYCVARPLGIWSGETIAAYALTVFGPDRAQSLEYRFACENVLMQSAMQRTLFGWGRFGGFNAPDASGKNTVTDGLWIIVFGWMGTFGLAMLNVMLLLPTVLFLTRFRPATWFEPEVAPAAALAIILPLYMLDNLSNAMLNPIYAVAMGSVAGYRPRRGLGLGQDRADRLAAAAAGASSPAAVATTGRRGLRQDLMHDLAAEEQLADALAAADQDQHDAAQEFFADSIQSWQAAIKIQPTSVRLDQLAVTHARHARFLTRIDQPRAAIVERRWALAHWRTIQERDPQAEFARDAHAANLNDLAWLLINDGLTDLTEFEQAILMAEEAVGLAGDNPSFWNTLGIARYRHGDYYKAIHALSRSVTLSPTGGNAFDFYYLAMANQALGYPTPASDWLDRAETWSRNHPELEALLAPVRAEATDRFTPAGQA